MTKRKKIFIGSFLLAISLFLAGLFVGGNVIRQSLERESCLTNLKNANFISIAEKISNLDSAYIKLEITPERLEEINKKTARYLTCQLALDASEENYNKIKNLIKNLNISSEKKADSLDNLDDNYKKFQERKKLKESPIYFLATTDGSALCPWGREDKSVVEEAEEILRAKSLEKSVSDNILSEIRNYCDLVSRYSNNQQSLEEEIYQFNAWPSQIQDIEALYRWKMAWAFNFGGEKGGEKLCSNIENQPERNECLGLVAKIKNTQELLNNCVDIAEIEDKLKNFICEAF